MKRPTPAENTERHDRGIFERPKESGVWWVCYFDEKRRKHREKVGPKALAVKVYQKRKNEIAERRFFPERIRRREVLLADMIADCLARTKDTLRSQKERKRYGELWKKALPGRTLREITAGDLERYKARRLSGELKAADARKGRRPPDRVVPATVNRELSFLRRVFNVAIEDGLAETNPVKSKIFTKENTARVRYLADEEEAALNKALGEEWPKAALAIHTGLRRGEQFGLLWENVDFVAGVITIPRSKSGVARRVPMNDTARELLRTLPSRFKRKWVFPSEAGKTKLDPKNFVRRTFLPALKEAKIDGLRWHDLRHTFASRLVMRCVDLRTVQELMGHQSIEMTLRYSHLSPRHQLEAVQRLNEKPGDTSTDTKPEEKSAVVRKRRPKTAKAPDSSEAFERAGDRGRTGDVQLGKMSRRIPRPPRR